MTRVLVTGGAGFIGSHVVDALVARGDEVHVVDDLSTGSESFLNPAAKLHRLDVASPAARELIEELRPGAVHHLAARISVPDSIARPSEDALVNVAGTAEVMAAARAVGARFVFASSAAVYPTTAPVPAPEEAAGWPPTPYGAGKLAAEMYISAFARQAGLEYTVLRFANVYGPRQGAGGEGGVVAVFCRAACSGTTAVVHGDGEQTRDFVYVGDVARAAVLAADRPAGCSINVSTGVETTIDGLWQLVAPGVEADHGPERPGDVRRSALDPSLAADLLGWWPEVTLADGVRLTLDWFRAG